MPKKRLQVAVPKGRFTIPDLAKQNPHVSTFVLQCRLRDWLKTGMVQFVGKARVDRTVKAHYIYQMAGPGTDQNRLKGDRMRAPALEKRM